MSQSTETTRPDPLIDAYRQASVREGARAGADVRAAVLAHARVVAQSSDAAVAVTGLTDATRDTPAANESRPIWRLAAGVLIGLVGVWIFQLTRPSAAPDTTVAVATAPSAPTAPQADKAHTAEPVAAATPTSPPAAAAPEATVAVAAPAIAKGSTAKSTSAARERLPEATLPEQNLAMEKALATKEKADRPAEFAGATIAAATAPAAPVSGADTSFRTRGRNLTCSSQLWTDRSPTSSSVPLSTYSNMPLGRRFLARSRKSTATCRYTAASRPK